MKAMNPVVWFEIYVDDMNRAKKFYEAVFQIELYELPMPDTMDKGMQMMSFPSDENSPGASGSLVKMKGFDAGGNSSLVYFRSDDCSVEGERVTEAGGKIVESKTAIGEFGFMLLATDSEGNMFGIHSMK